MKIEEALEYSDKARRRSWLKECFISVSDGDEYYAIDECGLAYVYHNDENDDWEPVPLPGDITILCRGCGEEFYGMLVPEGDYKFWTVRKQREYDVSIDLFCPECNHVYFRN